MLITKKPEKIVRNLKNYYYFNWARDAFEFVLRNCKFDKEKILLPAYIGWSSKEGSGVFDPIKKLNCQYDFYKINKKIEVDINDLEDKIKKIRPKAILIIHYFGFVDPNINIIYNLSKKYNAFLIEDEAHSMLTNLIGGKSGHFGLFSIFSLHKIFPVKKGGVLVTHKNDFVLNKKTYLDFFRYNLASVSINRINHWNIINSIIKSEKNPYIIPLHEELRSGIIPQSYPILIKRHNRDFIYYEMNRKGFGVVSLYHTLIKEIRENEYPESYHISKSILNLPVHQDINVKNIYLMMEYLFNLIKK